MSRYRFHVECGGFDAEFLAEGQEPTTGSFTGTATSVRDAMGQIRDFVSRINEAHGWNLEVDDLDGILIWPADEPLSYPIGGGL